MREIRPVSAFGRPQEAGRIRIGAKTASGQPKSLSTFRLTSTDEQAIRVLADTYGGEIERWEEPRAAMRDQWQVTTEAAELDVLLPSEGALTVFYEQWSAAGCQRRCDGEECTLPLNADGDEETTGCICAVQNVMLCKPKTRLSVILPQVEFRGHWRLETGSWAAADEMSNMEPLLASMQARGILRAKLVLEQRSKPGKRFVVPKLVLAVTPEELASGRGVLAGIPVRSEQQALGTGKIEEGDRSAGSAASGTALPSVTDGTGAPSPSPPSLDDEILDAELIDDGPSGNGQPYGIEDDMTDPTAGMTDDEKAWETSLDLLEVKTQLDRKVLVRAICLSATDGFGEKVKDLTPEGWMLAVQKCEDLTRPGITVTGVGEDGRLLVKRS